MTLGVGLATTACGDDSSDGAAQTTSSAPTTTESSEPTTTAPTTTAPTTTSTSRSTTSSSSATSTGDGGVLGEDDGGRRLGLNDYFMPDSQWQERRYDLADQQDVQGIGSPVGSCGSSSSYSRELELRLGNNFDQLTFSVAQANDSEDSDQSLAVEVVANNEQAEVRSVPFNLVQDFTINVDGVNALVIRLYLDDAVDNCGGSVIGVITGATLT